MPSFRYEAEMARAVASWMRRSGLTARPEFRTASGIADMVGCRWIAGAVRSRLAARQRRPLGPLLRVAIFEAIPPRRRVSLASLVARFEAVCGPEALRAEVAQLVRDRFVTVVPGQRVTRVAPWSRMSDRVVAVELKLSRLSEAIRQARQYLVFADDVYVALPKRAALDAVRHRRDQLAGTGVGILAVGRRAAQVVLRPSRVRRAHAVDPAARQHAVERLWRFALESAEHQLPRNG